MMAPVYWQGRRGPARDAELFAFGRFNPTMVWRERRSASRRRGRRHLTKWDANGSCRNCSCSGIVV